MSREYCEMLAEYLVGGFEPNPIEKVRNNENHDVPICRVGERHTFGGAAAEHVERAYEGSAQASDSGIEGLTLTNSQPWEKVPGDEGTMKLRLRRHTQSSDGNF